LTPQVAPTAAKGVVAVVHPAEIRAGRGVVDPDLVLVIEHCRALPGDDQRRHPARLLRHALGCRVIQSRDSDSREAVECRAPGKVSGQVGVINARAIGPGELAVNGARADRHRRITDVDQTALVVPGDPPDQSNMARAYRLGAAVSGSPTGVR